MRKPTHPGYCRACVRKALADLTFTVTFPTAAQANTFAWELYAYRRWLRAEYPDSPDTFAVELVKFSHTRGSDTVTIRRKGGEMAATIEKALQEPEDDESTRPNPAISSST